MKVTKKLSLKCPIDEVDRWDAGHVTWPSATKLGSEATACTANMQVKNFV